MKRTISLLAVVAAPVWAGEVFEPSRATEVVRIRLDRNDLLLESIQSAIARNGVQDGAVVSAAGSLQECTWHGVKSLAVKPEQLFTSKKGPCWGGSS